VADSEVDIVEIVSPVADAMGALADLIQSIPGSLSGASIAKSDRGTLLLNRRAWELFGASLNSALPKLVIAHPASDDAKPLKFLLVSAHPPDS
jgi:hypothetical protein